MKMDASSPGNRILVVDNDRSIVWVLEKALTDEGYAVDTANDGRQGYERAETNDYALVIMDIMMPVMDGLTALTKIRALSDPPEVIMITAHSNMDNTVEAMKHGAFEYIVKPFDIDEVIDLTKRAIRRYVTRKSGPNDVPPGVSSRIIGSTPAMRDLYKVLGRVASTTTSVLITGETGTGKDLFARAIHYHSARRDKPFITVNCASIPGELLESELFGHVKGAFTGATGSRQGKCEAADGGTLFLDEIGTMRLDLQAKLLRFLQHSEFEPVGSSETRHVDVRVIAATNANLAGMVKKGTFREDLFYRLMVVPINMPTLRERGDDIPALAHYFVERYNAKYGLSFSLSADILRSLRKRDWPGNVRELENHIHRMVVLQADSVEAAADPGAVIPGRGVADDIESVVTQLVESGLPNLLDVARERIEKPLLVTVMSRVRNNQSEAAKLLGISRNTLRKMLANYGID